MEDISILDDSRFYAVTQYLYLLFENGCFQMGDITLIEYSMLMRVAQSGQDYPLSQLKDDFSFIWGHFEHHLELLENKELLERRRNANDRRSFCVRLTLKGQQRLYVVDAANAYSLIDTAPRVTEERFETLVQLLYQLDDGVQASSKQVGMFPAVPLRLLCQLRQALVGECAKADLSVSQFVILSLLSSSEDKGGLEEAEIMHRVAPWVSGEGVNIILSSLVEKQLLRRGGLTSVTEAGSQRAALVSNRLKAKITKSLGGYTAQQRQAIIQVVENCLYLFG